MWRPVDLEETPEGRIAAAASNLLIEMDLKFRRPPDFADFRDRFKPFIERELARARMDELDREMGLVNFGRLYDLTREIDRLDQEIAPFLERPSSDKP